jgi:hypothetical protein
VAAAQEQQQQTGQAQQTQSPSTKLINKDVAEMLKAGLSAEIVVAKIRSSATAFDTSAAALQEMKAAGVPDSVILAMVEAPAGGPAATTMTTVPAAAPVEVKVPDGTEVEIELINLVTGEEVKVGSLVDFKVIHPVVLNGVTIFERDAPARARITTAKKAGRWGRAGKLEWAMQDAQAADGNRVPMRFTDRALGDSKGGTVAVAAVATTVLLGPIGLLWGLKKGKPAIIPAGNRYRVFVHGDTAIKGKPAPATAGS